MIGETLFSILFGMESFQVKKNCVVLPCLGKDLSAAFKIGKLSKGKLYQCENHDNFTLIRTGMHAGLTADAVLYLKETSCRNIILFGSCGAVCSKTGLSIGDLVSPSQCHSYESFSEMLLKKNQPKVFLPQKDFHTRLLKSNPQIKSVVCATVASLKLEEESVADFTEKGISVVDMECSAFFAAADYVGLNAAGLFYVTDIIKEKPFYLGLEPDLKFRRSQSIRTAAELVFAFF